MTSIGQKRLLLILGSVLLGSCSLALDFDELNKGSPDTDTGPECEIDGDCDDGINCTEDSCLEDGTCRHVPDNSLCEYLEMCDLDEGCVPTGDECKDNADCDDGVDCTVDTCILLGGGKECDHQPDHDLCSSGDLCMENENCHITAGCLDGTPVVCEQSGAPCMITECEASSGDCVDVLMSDADDDSDTYLDILCGGDDCNDSVFEINPAASEICGYTDDNCDGYVDLEILADSVVVASGPSLNAPSLAFDGTSYAVAWQQNDVATQEVKIRFIEPDGTMISTAHDFTTLGGSGAEGFEPDVTAASDRFHVIWISQVSSSNPEARVLDLTVDTSSGVVTEGTLVTLETGAATELTSPVIKWDDPTSGSGWLAGWCAGFTGGTGTVEIQTFDMHSTPAGNSFVVSTDTGSADGVSVEVLGTNDYIVAFSREESSSGGDLEISESRIELSGDVWANVAGYPTIVSTVESVLVDGSYEPAVSLNGSGGWAIAYTDTMETGPSTNKNVLAWDGSANITLAATVSDWQYEPSLAWNGVRFGIIHTATLGASAKTLEFILFDSFLQSLAAPYVGTRLEQVAAGEDIRQGRLLSDGSGGFAAVWIMNDGTTDNVIFSTFSGCTP